MAVRNNNRLRVDYKKITMKELCDGCPNIKDCYQYNKYGTLENLYEVLRYYYMSTRKLCNRIHIKIINKNSELNDTIEKLSSVFKFMMNKERCVICGFDKHPAAIDMHHIHPEEKENGFGKMYYRNSKKKLLEIIEERRRCISVCSNCHRLIHVKAIVLTKEDIEKYYNEYELFYYNHIKYYEHMDYITFYDKFISKKLNYGIF